MAKVVLESVVKKFGMVTAVHDLSIEIGDREFVTLVGPSGCGKTTTLRMIAGLEKVTAGQIYFDDDPVGHLPADHRDIAMVFQSYALYPHMNVFDNIGFALRMMRVSRAEIDQRVKWAAEMLGISDLLFRKPRQLSGGQRQRVALGRSMVRQPACFLLDEPLSNLDAQLRVTMRGELKRLHLELKRTFIYVTHDQAEALTMSDRIAVISAGHLQQYGSPDEIYNRPGNVFVAGFMGSPAMNLLRGEISVTDSTPHFVATALDVTVPTRLAACAQRAKGRGVFLGIRPESIVVRGDGVDTPPSGANWIPATVYINEPLGSDQFLTLDIGETRVKVRAGPDLAVRATDRVEVAFEPAKLHLFDGETGASLTN
ncbi:MAG TPA: ABC transporter ATP-binding protein [Ktedonobacterales bacterium]|nr:ABC transporter ATP-binding protein [Ktedonobacterales bacterium]